VTRNVAADVLLQETGYLVLFLILRWFR